MNAQWTTAVATTALAGLLGPANPPAPVDPPPSFLLIVLDDVGIEKLEWWPFRFFDEDPYPHPCWGYPATPALESLYEHGIAFTNAWSNPVCSASRASILTGRHGHRTGMGDAMVQIDQRSLASEELLIPELLKTSYAYAAGAFGKWHVSKLDDFCHPVRNGFDVFRGHMANVRTGALFPGNGRGHHFYWEKVAVDATADCSDCKPIVTAVGSPDPLQAQPADWSATDIVTEALAWIEAQGDSYFAYLAPNVPHDPIQVPPHALLCAGALCPCVEGYPSTGAPGGPNCVPSPGCSLPPMGTSFSSACDQAQKVQVFNMTIAALDQELGRLLDGLAAAGRLDDTFIIVVGDNGTPQRSMDGPYDGCNAGVVGECFTPGDRACIRHDAPWDPKHAKNSIYQLGTRVPMIVTRGADYVAGTTVRRQSAQVVSIVDIWRTVAELAGVDVQAAIDAQPSIDELTDANDPCPDDTQDDLDPSTCAGTRGVHADQWTYDSVSLAGIVLETATSSGRVFALSEQFWPNDQYGAGSRTMLPEWCSPASWYRRAITDGVHKYVDQTPTVPPGAPIGIPPCNGTREFFELSENPWELNCEEELCTSFGGVCCECTSCNRPAVQVKAREMQRQLCEWLQSGN